MKTAATTRRRARREGLVRHSSGLSALLVLLVLLLGTHHAAMGVMATGDDQPRLATPPLATPFVTSSPIRPTADQCACWDACPLTQARVPEPPAGTPLVALHGWARVAARVAPASLSGGWRAAQPRAYTARAYCAVLGVFRI